MQNTQENLLFKSWEYYRPLKALFRSLIYRLRFLNELRAFRKNKMVHDLPEIFHYWSNKYLLPKLQQFGFNNPDEFFYKYCLEKCQQLTEKPLINILSVGSGNGELEVNIAKHLVENGITNFVLECMDINARMHKRTVALAQEQGMAKHIKTLKADFNKWQPTQEYDIVIANQSLHHVTELEYLFDGIYSSLTEQGIFIISDMIGRNGHQRWPEALKLVNDYWRKLPKKYKYNCRHKRHEINYVNFDCSITSFEGVRAQDILPLLIERFEFRMFLPFANIIMVFIDRKFGHNFDVNNPNDLKLIDEIHAEDEAAILSGKIKPTQMLTVLNKSKIHKIQLLDTKLTPEFCLRQP